MSSNSSIEDLIKKSKLSSKPGEESVGEKFDLKIKEIGDKQKESEAEQTARNHGRSYINLTGFSISPDALKLSSKESAKKTGIVPFLYIGSEIRVAITDPKNPQIAEFSKVVAEKTRGNVKIYICSQKSFESALKLYDTLPEIKEIVKGIDITGKDLTKFRDAISSIQELRELVKKTTVTDFLAMIIATAVDSDSSDIHIESEETQVVVRFRIDGVLNNVAEVERSAWPRIINRLKLISGLKISITTSPQDGRFTIFLGNTTEAENVAKEKIEVRVSTLPTAYGESVVMRLLKPATIAVNFDALGVRGKAYEQLKRETERPNGMVITTGPTGSGKTTTQYAILKKLNTKDVKIITLEDPVEYKLEGVNQSQVDKSKNYTFDKGLVSILRQDPDIIMVGEIRDVETAEVAIQAALTGHILLSTVHTNSASGAIPRLLSMGVKPFLLAPALNAVIGQRLVRKIHADCKIDDVIDIATIEKIKKILSELNPDSGYTVDFNNMKFSKGQGCDKCNRTGFKGRLGIYEIFTMSQEIEKIILSGAVSEYQMQEVAIKQGMITMVQDGLLKALDGVTSVDEIFRVSE